MIPLALAACALLAVLAALAVRRPVPRRLAARFALRRPLEAALVVAGCSLAVAVLTAALLVGDVLEASLRQRAADRLGPVDVAVRSAAPVVADAVATALTFDPPPGADGVLVMTTGEAALTAAADGRVLTAVAVGEADLDAAAGFGGDPLASGISGPTPTPGEVVLSGPVAERLGVVAGGEVRLTAYGAERTLRVARVVPGSGLSGLALAPGPAPPWVFVTPGLLSELAFARPLQEGARAPERVVLLSGAGSVLGGSAGTAALTAQVAERLGTVEGWEAAPLKADELTAAREDAESYAALFGSLGAFTVLAGAALLANVCLLLAQERRREHGVLRALGLRRADLVLTAVLEGALYAGAASVLGTLAGLGLAGLVVALAGEVLGGAASGGMTLRFAVAPASLLLGPLAGTAVALVTVTATALRTAGLAPTAATTAPPTPRPASLRTALTRTAAALALTAAAALAVTLSAAPAGSADATADAGPPASATARPAAVALPALALAAAGEAVLAWRRGATRQPGAGAGCSQSARRGRRRRGAEAVVVRRVAAGGAAAWALAAFGVLGLDGTQVAVFAAQGVVLSLAGVAALSVRAGGGSGLLGRVRGELGIALRLARAQRRAGPLRSAGTLLAYALATFVLAFSVLLSATFSSRAAQQVADEGGGADLLVTTSAGTPLGAAALSAAPGVADVATLRWGVARFRAPALPGGQDWPLSGFDADLLRIGAPALESFDATRFADERAVWEAVLADPRLAVADVAFGQRGGGPPQRQVEVGETLTVTDLATGAEARREVVAISAAGAAASGVLVSAESVAQLWTVPVGNRHHVAVAAGADPQAVAGELERANLAAGLTARPFGQVVDEALAEQSAFFDLIESQLALGLAVGVAGLGVVAMRTVRERHRQVAVLRALGCPPSLVRTTFLVESGTAAAQGLALGTGLALITCSALVTGTDVFGDAGALAVPWVELGAFLLSALAASVLVVLPAAQRAARTPPAIALRAA